MRGVKSGPSQGGQKCAVVDRCRRRLTLTSPCRARRMSTARCVAGGAVAWRRSQLDAPQVRRSRAGLLIGGQIVRPRLDPNGTAHRFSVIVGGDRAGPRSRASGSSGRKGLRDAAPAAVRMPPRRRAARRQRRLFGCPPDSAMASSCPDALRRRARRRPRTGWDGVLRRVLDRLVSQRHGYGVVAESSTGSSTGSAETDPDEGAPGSTSDSRSPAQGQRHWAAQGDTAL